MSQIGSYEERVNEFNWEMVENELGYKKGDNVKVQAPAGEYTVKILKVA